MVLANLASAATRDTVSPTESRSIARTIRARCRHALNVMPICASSWSCIGVIAPRALRPCLSTEAGATKASWFTFL